MLKGLLHLWHLLRVHVKLGLLRLRCPLVEALTQLRLLRLQCLLVEALTRLLRLGHPLVKVLTSLLRFQCLLGVHTQLCLLRLRCPLVC